MSNREANESIEHILNHSLRAWESLPEVAEEISSWEPDERIDFLYEWTLEEQRLERLRKWARGTPGSMAAERRRLEELEALVERHRPVIEDLRKRFL